MRARVLGPRYVELGRLLPGSCFTYGAQAPRAPRVAAGHRGGQRSISTARPRMPARCSTGGDCFGPVMQNRFAPRRLSRHARQYPRLRRASRARPRAGRDRERPLGDVAPPYRGICESRRRVSKRWSGQSVDAGLRKRVQTVLGGGGRLRSALRPHRRSPEAALDRVIAASPPAGRSSSTWTACLLDSEPIGYEAMRVVMLLAQGAPMTRCENDEFVGRTTSESSASSAARRRLRPEIDELVPVLRGEDPAHPWRSRPPLARRARGARRCGRQLAGIPLASSAEIPVIAATVKPWGSSALASTPRLRRGGASGASPPSRFPGGGAAAGTGSAGLPRGGGLAQSGLPSPPGAAGMRCAVVPCSAHARARLPRSRLPRLGTLTDLLPLLIPRASRAMSLDPGASLLYCEAPCRRSPSAKNLASDVLQRLSDKYAWPGEVPAADRVVVGPRVGERRGGGRLRRPLTRRHHRSHPRSRRTVGGMVRAARQRQ